MYYNYWKRAVVAEWLRRWTWNPLGFPRAGSNPAGCEIFFYTKNPLKSKIICPWKHFVDVVVEVYVIYAIMMLTVHTDGLDYDTSLCVRIACVYAGYMQYTVPE